MKEKINFLNIQDLRCPKIINNIRDFHTYYISFFKISR